MFRACIENAPIGIIVAGQGVPVLFNDAYLRLFGYTAEEAAGTGMSKRIAPEEVPGLQAWVARLMSGEQVPIERETVGVRKDGTHFPLLMRLTAVEVEGTRLPVGFLTDISAFKAADEARRRSEQDLRHLIERSPDGILVETETEILFANQEMARLMGFERPEDLVGQDPAMVARPEDREALRMRMHRAFATGELPPPAERSLVRRDGTTLAVEVLPSGTIQFAGQGAIFVVIRDISARHAMQARLLLSDRLATVGTMAASVAHEINNPLAFVAMNVAYAAERVRRALPPDDPAAEAVRTALAAAAEGALRMRDIVDRLAGFARVDADSRKPVDVCAVLESALRLAGNELRHRARVVQAFEAVPTVLASAPRLVQVFLNLLVNAAQALGEREGGVDEVTVRVREAGGRVVVEVQDTGPGIPADVMPHVFDPFFTTKPVGGGTGLGLSISHSIITELGGEIAVESELGRGTTFRVTLDAARDDAAGMERFTPHPPRPSVARMRVLVADDEPEICAAIVRCLDEHDVTVVGSGREALVHCREDVWDLVLCDLMMPDVTGMELYEELRGSHPVLANRVVFMTGGAVTPRARVFVAEHGRRVLKKPFDLASLLQLVSETQKMLQPAS